MKTYDDAYAALHNIQPDASDEAIITAAVDYLLALGPQYAGKWHFGTLSEAHVPHDWRRGTMWGITTKDPDRARAWASERMRAGMAVFSFRVKDAHGGSGPGSVKAIRAQRRAMEGTCASR